MTMARKVCNGTVSGKVDEPIPELLEPARHEEFPPTEDQRNEKRRKFIGSLVPDAVCALASRFNAGRPCRIVKKASGSFNICFFVEFKGGPTWVVRVSLETSLDDPWDKLLSEVATIRYLERHSRIPVPHVHGYGRDARLAHDDGLTQMFIILDLIPGQPLDTKLLVSASEDRRKSFHSQLIDILTDLRKLVFPLIGSLMPDPDGLSDPVLGPVLSMTAATLRRPPPPAPFDSGKQYTSFEFSLVSELFLAPSSNYEIDDVRREVFALSNMKPVFDQVIDPQLDKGPFVLCHQDLRGPNIIVDENLHIQGIIDWEFANTVPLQLFTPPSWITGHGSTETDKQMHAEFQAVLNDRSKTDRFCSQLQMEWYGTKSRTALSDAAFYVAHSIRRPSEIASLVCDVFVPEIFGKSLDDAMSGFFQEHPALEAEVQRRLEECRRYTQYLNDNGWYETADERFLAESKAFKKEMGWL